MRRKENRGDMWRKILAVSMMVGLAGFLACQQCMECQIRDSNGQLADTKQTCGTSTELNQYEQDCKDTYASVGYTCECAMQ